MKGHYFHQLGLDLDWTRVQTAVIKHLTAHLDEQITFNLWGRYKVTVCCWMFRGTTWVWVTNLWGTPMVAFDFNQAEIPWPAQWFNFIKEVQSGSSVVGLVE